jgi:signal transduction histidine kinase
MIDTLWNKRGSVAGFALVLALVGGGLAGVSRAALRVEEEQLTQKARSDRSDILRLALWRLDSRISNILAREDSRPFNHFSAVYAPPAAYTASGFACPTGSVLEPSPLLNVELPSWMLLHFQTDVRGWESPQVLSPGLRRWLARASGRTPPANATPERERLLADLGKSLPVETLLTHARRHTSPVVFRDRILLAKAAQAGNLINNDMQGQGANSAPATQEFYQRAGGQSKLALPYNNSNYLELRVDKDLALLNFCRNGEEWLNQANATSYLSVEDPMRPKGGPLPPKALAKASKDAPLPPQPPPVSATSTPQTWNLPTVALDGFAYKVPANRSRSGAETTVSMSPMVGVWLSGQGDGERLVVLRLVHVEKKEVCQGIVLDAAPLRELLAEEVADLFPEAHILPAKDPEGEDLALTMTTLPLRLDPGPEPESAGPGWTTLRVGLSLAWAAATIALLAVALGGWSLIDLSERRIRFVSAVTHELRTPLTTLRLYLDMLISGLVKEEPKRQEYIETMDAETARLVRLVDNVLDFSRLERQNPRLTLSAHGVEELLAPVVAAWGFRCTQAGKKLELDNDVPAGVLVRTDSALLVQVLGNLIDNACKYSRDAADPTIRLRVRQEGKRLLFEVEDRGPGIPVGERRTIFRPFRRGREADATTGGVGLGLALASRWAQLLGGRLTLESPPAGGACFRVELPAE